MEDVSLADGSHVQPGTKLVKKWRMLNDGTHAWDDNTYIIMVWGNMTPVQPQFPVPHLKVRTIWLNACFIVAWVN